jgi:hypothetical protein
VFDTISSPFQFELNVDKLLNINQNYKTYNDLKTDIFFRTRYNVARIIMVISNGEWRMVDGEYCNGIME